MIYSVFDGQTCLLQFSRRDIFVLDKTSILSGGGRTVSSKILQRARFFGVFVIICLIKRCSFLEKAAFCVKNDKIAILLIKNGNLTFFLKQAEIWSHTCLFESLIFTIKAKSGMSEWVIYARKRPISLENSHFSETGAKKVPYRSIYGNCFTTSSRYTQFLNKTRVFLKYWS